MNTDARRKASAGYHAKRIASGDRKVTVWLSPAGLAALEALKAAHGTRDKAADAALVALASAGAENPSKASKPDVKHTPKSASKQPKPAPDVESVKLSVPLAGTFARPIYQKGSKR